MEKDYRLETGSIKDVWYGEPAGGVWKILSRLPQDGITRGFDEGRVGYIPAVPDGRPAPASLLQAAVQDLGLQDRDRSDLLQSFHGIL